MRSVTNGNIIGRIGRIAGLRAAGLFVAGICALAVVAAGMWSSPAAAAPMPVPTSFASTSTAQSCNNTSFFGLEPWYNFLPDQAFGVQLPNGGVDKCAIHCFNFFVRDKSNPNDCGLTESDVPGVILAIVDDMLRISAIVAVVFIIIGSFQYVGSRGNSERTASAQSTILNALIGLAIALVAVGLVSFIGHSLGG